MQSERRPAPGEQQSYIDLRAPLRLSEKPPLPDTQIGSSAPENDAGNLQEEQFEEPRAVPEPRKRAIAEEHVSTDSSEEERTAPRRPSKRPITDAQREERTPLEQHLQSVGLVDDPGSCVARALAERGTNAASSARERSRSHGKSYEAKMSIENKTCPVMREYEESMAFFAARTPTPSPTAWLARKTYRKANLEKRGTLLKYASSSPRTQQLLNGSRVKEWANYMKFRAVKVISHEEAQEFKREGAEEIPMQCIEVQQNLWEKL